MPQSCRVSFRPNKPRKTPHTFSRDSTPLDAFCSRTTDVSESQHFCMCSGSPFGGVDDAGLFLPMRLGTGWDRGAKTIYVCGVVSAERSVPINETVPTSNVMCATPRNATRWSGCSSRMTPSCAGSADADREETCVADNGKRLTPFRGLNGSVKSLCVRLDKFCWYPIKHCPPTLLLGREGSAHRLGRH